VGLGGHVDPVLLDMRLPVWSGTTVLAAIRMDVCYRDIPVVITTGLPLQEVDHLRITIYLCLWRLFLPFGFLFRHGSSGGDADRVARKARPSKRDARERRERSGCLPTVFLGIIVSLAW
jgi:CheY-like chemotaxis protein